MAAWAEVQQNLFETAINKIVFIWVEPRQIAWISESSLEGEKRAETISRIIRHSLLNLIEEDLIRLEAFSQKTHAKPQGSSYVGLILDPETLKKIQGICQIGNLPIFISSILRLTFLNSHPDQPEEEQKPQSQPSIFFLPGPENNINLNNTEMNPEVAQESKKKVEIVKRTSGAEVENSLQRLVEEIKSQQDKKPSQAKKGRHMFHPPYEFTPEEEKILNENPLFTKEEIKVHRDALSLTQGQLAQKLRLSRGLIADAERGRRQSEQTLRRLTVGIILLEKKLADSKGAN